MLFVDLRFQRLELMLGTCELALDEFQSLADIRFGLDRILFNESRSNKLVDIGIIGEHIQLLYSCLIA